jgi:hypothetical protein
MSDGRIWFNHYSAYGFLDGAKTVESKESINVFKEGYGDLESRSPTPTPPVLEPEVPPKPEPVKEEEVKLEMPLVTLAEVTEAKKEEAQTTEVKEDIKASPISAPTSAPIDYVTPTMAPVAEPIPEEEDKYIPRLLDVAGNGGLCQVSQELLCLHV